MSRTKREKGKLISDKRRKWMLRVYIMPTLSIDLIPQRWKYHARNTRSKAPSDASHPSYAIKWLCFTLHLERVRMGLRQ